MFRQRQQRSMYKTIIANVAVYILVVFGMASCTTSQRTGIENESKVTLQFEKMNFFQSTGQFFEIKVNLKQKIFSRPQHIEICQADLLKTDKGLLLRDKDVLSSFNNLFFVWDVSPDQKWGSFFELTSKQSGDTGYPSLLNLSDKKKTRIPFSGKKMYFSSDSRYVFMVYNWKLSKAELAEKTLEIIDSFIGKMETSEELLKENEFMGKLGLPEGTVKEIDDTTTFFQTPDRKQLILFYDGCVKRMDVSTGMCEKIGKYPYIAYDSGFINQRYGYFITAISNKGGPKNLFVIDLEYNKIIPCPFSLSEAAVINVKR
jgi:hypothetical protein